MDIIASRRTSEAKEPNSGIKVRLFENIIR
jgi:hypothetical protein